MLIRDERQLMLDDIVKHCRKLAARYQQNASLAEDSVLAGLFLEISRERRELADVLENHQRRLGWLPAAPDPDAELVEELITKVKIAWSEDHRRELLAEMLQAEDRLAALIAAALRHEIPAAIKEVLQRMQETVAFTLKRLAAA
jgi:uncharacterized protein (TIGR02284 family)